MLEFERICIDIHSLSRSMLKWEWDARFLCVVAAFPIEDKNRVLKGMKKYFPVKWDGSNIRESPQTIQGIADYLGGIAPGQQLLSPAPDEELRALVALWPWNNGRTVSIRILPILSSYPPDEIKDFIERFKDWFKAA